MIPKKIINELIKIVVVNKVITPQDIENVGATEYLNGLLASRILERNESGVYVFISDANLKDFISGMRKVRDFYYANLAIKYLADLRPNYVSANMSAFIACLQSHDYSEAFKYYNVLVKENNNSVADNKKLFLFMFSYLLDLDPYLVAETRRYKLNDLNVSNTKHNDATETNAIVLAVYKNQFNSALSKVIERKKLGHKMYFDILLYNFVCQLYDEQGVKINKMKKMAEDKQYTELRDFIEEERKKHPLSYTFLSILKLAKLLIKSQDGKEIFARNSFTSNSIHHAIKIGEFYNAMEMVREYKDPDKGTSSIIELLLGEVCEKVKVMPEKENENYLEDWSIVSDDAQKEGLSISVNSDPEFAKYVVERASRVPGMHVNSILGSYLIVKYQDLENYDESRTMADAKVAYQNGEYDEAIKSFKKIIRNTELLNLNIYAFVGLSYYNKGDFESACLYFDIASSICVSRGLEDPYQTLVMALLNNGQLSKEDLFKEAEKQKMANVLNEDELVSLFACGYSGDPRDNAMSIYEENRVKLKAIEAAYAVGNVGIAEKLLEEVQNNPNTEFLKDEISAITGKARIYNKKAE